ncbi:Bifunctional purine biosynthetic protein ADE5,7 [Rhodotorula kratochvilovae]
MTTHAEPSVRNWRVTVLISGSGSNLQALLDATQLPASDPHSLAHCTITAVLSSRSDAYGLVRARSFAPSPTPAEAFPLLRWKKAPENQGKTRDDWEQDLAARIRATRPDVVVLAGWMLILGERFLNALVRDWDENASPSPASSPPLPSFDPSGATVGSGLPTPGPSPYAPAAQEALKGRPIPIINLHPALPGQFPGAHAIRDAWDAFNLPVESSLSSSASAASATLEALGTADPAAEAKTGGRRIDKTGIMIHRVIPLLDAGRPVVVKEVPMVEGESLEGLETRIHEVEHGAIVEAVAEVVRLVRDGAWWDEEDTGRTTGEQ